MESRLYQEVVFPKVVITNPKEFMFGDACRRYNYLKVETPPILPYSKVSIEELKHIRDGFIDSYIDLIKQRFHANYFSKYPNERFLERLEERSAEHFNMMSILDAYINSIENNIQAKKHKKQRYRRNKKEKMRREFNEDSNEGLHQYQQKEEEENTQEEDRTERFFYEIQISPKKDNQEEERGSFSRNQQWNS